MTSLSSLLSPHLPIIVAVSGGADSLCLLGTLHEQGYSLIVAHFDHQLRPDSGNDAKFVEELAGQYQLPFLCGTADVNAYAKTHKQSIEEAARNSRYHFLFEQARQHKAQAVAVGHTADDQVETVLMHFLRGAGLSGLKGILPSTILPHFDPEIPLVRPILDLCRADTEAWCTEHNLVPREDPTNASTDYFRNRLRHVLIPELETYNPRFREVLVRTSHALQGDHALLTELVDQSWEQVLLDEAPTHISLNFSALAQFSPALLRNLIKKGMEKLLTGQSDLSFATLERAAAFIADPNSPQRIDLASGLLLFKEQDALYLTSDLTTLPLDAFPQMKQGKTRKVSLDGLLDEQLGVESDDFSEEIVIKSFGLGADRWVLTASTSVIGQALKNDDPFQVALDADALDGELSLRTRRAGDRFHPLGMSGKSMKLKDFFINDKLPQRARDGYPLLCDGEGIIWIPGFRPAHRVRVTDATQRVVTFVMKRK